MLINCPNCDTSFAVPSKALSGNGRKLKCSQCFHVWFQSPIDYNRDKLDEYLDVTPINNADDTNLPVKIKREINYIAPLVILLVIGLTFFIGKYKDPVFSGLTYHNSLKFSEFYAKSEIQDNKYHFDIGGKIINSSDEEFEIPTLKIELLSRGGNIIKTQEVELKDRAIKPNETKDISIKLEKITGNSDRIKITMNHWLENLFLGGK